jgi:hypothetical protein
VSFGSYHRLTLLIHHIVCNESSSFTTE